MPPGLKTNFWMVPEVAGHFRHYIVKRKDVMFTRTCPAMKSQRGKKDRIIHLKAFPRVRVKITSLFLALRFRLGSESRKLASLIVFKEQKSQ